MKLWIYHPRSELPEIHWSKETILEDMKDDFYWSLMENPDGEGTSWGIMDEHIFVDDGGEAWLVEVKGMSHLDTFEKILEAYEELRWQMDELQK